MNGHGYTWSSPSNFWMGVLTLLACAGVALFCAAKGYVGADGALMVGAVAAGPVTVIGLRESKAKVALKNGAGK